MEQFTLQKKSTVAGVAKVELDGAVLEAYAVDDEADETTEETSALTLVVAIPTSSPCFRISGFFGESSNKSFISSHSVKKII